MVDLEICLRVHKNCFGQISCINRVSVCVCMYVWMYVCVCLSLCLLSVSTCLYPSWAWNHRCVWDWRVCMSMCACKISGGKGECVRDCAAVRASSSTVIRAIWITRKKQKKRERKKKKRNTWAWTHVCTYTCVFVTYDNIFFFVQYRKVILRNFVYFGWSNCICVNMPVLFSTMLVSNSMSYVIIKSSALYIHT